MERKKGREGKVGGNEGRKQEISTDGMEGKKEEKGWVNEDKKR